eukprot:TRINITY_DN6339_c0_g1_i3.p1 TRINITY_DN6339_c0_g1~~TRINITY_DN6339_c0_g1_i3.p1  ORF type:complete len:253 (-),score=53.24 TRINITY_DN6339_c0_g1_i3:236-994(-)
MATEADSSPSPWPKFEDQWDRQSTTLPSEDWDRSTTCTSAFRTFTAGSARDDAVDECLLHDQRERREGLAFGSFPMQNCGEASMASLIREVAQVIRGCGHAVTLSDPHFLDRGFLEISQSFETMTEWNRSDLIGKELRMLFSGPHCISMKVESKIRHTELTGQACTAEVELEKLSGQLLPSMIHTRGFSIGRHAETGEERWLILTAHVDMYDEERDDLISKEEASDRAMEYFSMTLQTIQEKLALSRAVPRG